jgi:hypothetical protein|tara:strand:- start:617 stop:802 length:186 start_codon:yes stop_codon:yes gene_type:complete
LALLVVVVLEFLDRGAMVPPAQVHLVMKAVKADLGVTMDRILTSADLADMAAIMEEEVADV